MVVMDIAAYDQREKQLELREKLIEIEELRHTGVSKSWNLISDLYFTIY